MSAASIGVALLVLKAMATPTSMGDHVGLIAGRTKSSMDQSQMWLGYSTLVIGRSALTRYIYTQGTLNRMRRIGILGLGITMRTKRIARLVIRLRDLT